MGLVLLAAVLARPLSHLLYTVSRDANGLEDLPPDYMDDASRLNLTKIGSPELFKNHFYLKYGKPAEPTEAAGPQSEKSDARR